MIADPYQVDSESDSESEQEQSAEPVQAETETVGSKRKKPFWAPKHIAYVKGLPYSAVPDEYTKIFNDCGETVSITEQVDDDNKWTGCLFVRYLSEEGLKNAIAVWNGAVWQGESGDNQRYIKVQRHNEKKAAKKKKPRQDIPKPVAAGASKASSKLVPRKKTGDLFKVVVSNLKKDVTDEALRDAFTKCGTIKSVKTSRDKTRGLECKGYSHIEFTSKEGMDAALASNFNARIQGQVVTVRLPGASQSEVPLVDLGDLKPKAKAESSRSSSSKNIKKGSRTRDDDDDSL